MDKNNNHVGLVKKNQKNKNRNKKDYIPNFPDVLGLMLSIPKVQLTNKNIWYSILSSKPL
jgi:hypothetical protein